MTVTVRFVGSGDAFGSGGRFQTCILVNAPGIRFTMDFGATSLVALRQQAIDHNSIDVILLTHLHGDHCGGVPFLLMDAMLDAKRTRPLVIAGPRQTQRHLHALCEALLPGMHIMQPKFPLAYVEMPVGQPTEIQGLVVTPQPARHTSTTHPTALRVAVGGKIIAYTGDGEFTEEMAQVGRDADLLIAECYFYQKPVKWHLNYPELARHEQAFGAKRVILTHMSREMLAHVDEIPQACAEDGMVIDI